MKALVLIFVLLTPSLAEAECAWVLWSYVFSGPSGNESHSVDTAHATRQECDEAVRSKANVLKRRGYEDVVGGFPGSYEVMGTKGNNIWRFYCLPDTVDPRGPKGGRR